MENEIKKLEAEIQSKKIQLQKLKEKSNYGGIRKLEDFTIEEKVKIFNSFYEYAFNELGERINSPEDYALNEDRQYYMWETVMETFLGKDRKSFWKYWNSL